MAAKPMPWIVTHSRWVAFGALYGLVSGDTSKIAEFLLLGLEVYGIIGALVSLPILAVLRETAVYLSRHLRFERWDDTSRGLL